MNVAERFIRRPVVTILMMLGILLLGVTGYLFLPAVKPQNLDSPAILVSANLPGANAVIMESSVATPLERQFVTLTGLEAMTSVNDVGFTDIALEFNPNRNIDAAAQDVQGRDHSYLDAASRWHAQSSVVSEIESSRLSFARLPVNHRQVSRTCHCPNWLLF